MWGYPLQRGGKQPLRLGVRLALGGEDEGGQGKGVVSYHRMTLSLVVPLRL